MPHLSSHPLTLSFHSLTHWLTLSSHTLTDGPSPSTNTGGVLLFLTTNKSASHRYTAQINVSFFTFLEPRAISKRFDLSINVNDRIWSSVRDDIRRPPAAIWHHLYAFVSRYEWNGDSMPQQGRPHKADIFYCRYTPKPMWQGRGGGGNFVLN